jgi:predicted Zn-dependent protease
VSRALDLAEEVLRAAEGDEAEVLVHAERSGVARFASSIVHQPTLVDDAQIRLRIVRDGKVGWASTNRAAGLDELARRAGEAADQARPDPDFPGLAPPAEYEQVSGYDQETAELGPDDQARLAADAIAAAGEFGLYGYFTSALTQIALVSSTGLGAEQELTDAAVLSLSATEGASGWAEHTSWRVRDLDPAAVTEESITKAARTRDAQEIEPGTYSAVLEPYAVAELLRWFSYDSLGAQGFIEERSFFCDRIGERLFDEKVTLTDNGLDPVNFPKSFDFEGTPRQAVPMIENGVARGVVWDRTTAARAGDGQESTGHAPPEDWRFFGPLPTAFDLAPGDAASVDELAARIGDGIYVTRLHYLGIIDSRGAVLTGMTRDGTFRIRDGKVAEPLVNLRFTVPMGDVLGEVPGLTRDRMLVNLNELYGARYPFGAVVPALATTKFQITGTGSGPGL